MIKPFLILLLSCFLFWVYGIHILKYLFLYFKAIKRWDIIEGNVESIKPFPRSYGLVPTVSYEYKVNYYCQRVYLTYFSKSYINQKIQILVNPENPTECIQKSRNIVIKNIIALVWLVGIFILTSYSMLIKIFYD
jgi:hypothetical protein